MQEAILLEWISIRLGDLLRSSIKKPRSRRRPYLCTIDDCNASYRRQDHLTRHLLKHEGKLFKCPVDDCKVEFSLISNVKRHVLSFHGENSPSAKDGPKEFICQERGCGKVFKYRSKLQQHEETHVTLDSVEAMCLEPGCFQHFSNEKCLRAHIDSCHQYTNCEICGSKLSRKSIKRHLRQHDPDHVPCERIKCGEEGCDLTFSSQTNRNKHYKAVHLQSRPFACGYSGCGLRFAYKHVRDRHEQSGCHNFTTGDFEVLDEQFRSRPRGGRKRNFPTVEMLVRKRVSPFTGLDDYRPQFCTDECGNAQ